MTSWDFLVNRSKLEETKVVETAPVALSEGQARLSVDAFGFSANNITYAAFGDMIGYWNFFPVSESDAAEGWGRVPVWGFAEVVESLSDELPVGERVYGYLPMSTELVVEPGKVRPESFNDLSAHRSALPVTYNNYARNAGDPGYDEHFEHEQMLLRPLFFTSFLIDDFFDDNGRFGASVVVLTSASSKTAFGTAHLMNERDDLTVIGLTSTGNVEFVEGLGCYDQVLTYDQIDQIPSGHGSALIDFAGNAGVIRAVHEHLTDDLKHSAIIGGTHWDAEPPAGGDLPGPAQEFFFAPTQIEKRSKEWGREELQQRIAASWLPFIEKTNQWISIELRSGPDAVNDVYLETLAGNARPDVGIILTPGE